jgi:hypothetical protein
MRRAHVFAGAALIALTAASATAQTAPPPGSDPNDPWLWGDQAVLRGLDKVTADTRDFIAPVGEDVQFFALTVSVKRCAKRPPERTPEVIVGMEISDRRNRGEGGDRIFSGWMFGSSPALNPLEHPVYDVWVLDCVDSTRPEETPALSDPDTLTELEPSEPADTPLPGEVFD